MLANVKVQEYEFDAMQLTSYFSFPPSDSTADAVAAAFLTGLLLPQVTLTSLSPIHIFGSQCFAATSARCLFLKLTKAHLEAVTRVMDLMLSGALSWGVRSAKNSRSEDSVVDSGREERNREMID